MIHCPKFDFNLPNLFNSEFLVLKNEKYEDYSFSTNYKKFDTVKDVNSF